MAGLLGFSAAANHDRVGLVLFSDQIERHIAPGKGRLHVNQIVDEVMNFTPQSKGTSIAEPLDLLMHVAKRRAVVFLISDFQTTGFLDSLQAAARLHDIIAVSVVDPHEVELPKVGLVRIKDAETGKVASLDAEDPAVRGAFEEIAQDQRGKLWRQLDDAGVEQFSLWVGHDYIGTLHAFLRSRIQNRRGNHG